MQFIPVIGLEVHAQLSTATKIFCGCSTRFGAPPNHHTCPVCLGMPGVLPVLNGKVVEFAIQAGLALGCRINGTSVWARKNYFYPDLPKGYQISQFDLPLCEAGQLVIDTEDGEKAVRIKRIHLEEDAGKNTHDAGGAGSVVDFNRAGVPLIEIVSEPDLGTPLEASEYLRALRDILVALDISSGNLEEGSFRCDANISVMPVGATELGTRTELKNINSFRFVRHALEFEIARQIGVLEAGGRIVQETRLYDSAEGRTRSMRSKEEAHDYRYFPEPDLQPLRVGEPEIERLRRGLPELPRARIERFRIDYRLGHEDAKALVADVDPRVTAFFEATAVEYRDTKKLANWFRGELFRALKEGLADIGALKLSPGAFAGLLTLVDRGELSGSSAKDVFNELLASGGEPAEIMASKGLQQVSDTDALEEAIDGIIAAHPDEVSKYRGGKTQLLAFFTGQVMKATRGKANPGLANALLRKKLGD